jgi:hypothetical protein
MLPALPNAFDVLTLDARLLVIDWTPWVERSRWLKRLWLEPGDLLTLIYAFALADWAIQLSYRLHPTLAPTIGPGAPVIYPDCAAISTCR